jgi:hypothetical protein
VKVLFVGPSLYGEQVDLAGMVVRPPARQGDITEAVLEGATAIGLVDGLFDAVAAVWHKEILFALANGVRVLGAASMGALRAAECEQFGMEPVGAIAQSYVRGDRRDDADVCLAHCPRELGYAPLSEPLVDVEATVERLRALGRIDDDEARRLRESAAAMFFADRTLSAMLGKAGFAPERMAKIAAAYEQCRRSVKTEDALLLVARLRQLEARRTGPVDWEMHEPASWRRAVQRLSPASAGAPEPADASA